MAPSLSRQHANAAAERASSSSASWLGYPPRNAGDPGSNPQVKLLKGALDQRVQLGGKAASASLTDGVVQWGCRIYQRCVSSRIRATIHPLRSWDESSPHVLRRFPPLREEKSRAAVKATAVASPHAASNDREKEEASMADDSHREAPTASRPPLSTPLVAGDRQPAAGEPIPARAECPIASTQTTHLHRPPQSQRQTPDRTHPRAAVPTAHQPARAALRPGTGCTRSRRQRRRCPPRRSRPHRPR